ncbi:unnamed protein product [Blepharisma stoltei]|uniref:Uncharacterized protein n=1 Tax=Blepharisma stoltei TaxID=1481888 RepID=A0AAU9IYZ3_9CILI|nr:unnamed protein product [Blepharisma stoltei]
MILKMPLIELLQMRHGNNEEELKFLHYKQIIFTKKLQIAPLLIKMYAKLLISSLQTNHFYQKASNNSLAYQMYAKLLIHLWLLIILIHLKSLNLNILNRNNST